MCGKGRIKCPSSGLHFPEAITGRVLSEGLGQLLALQSFPSVESQASGAKVTPSSLEHLIYLHLIATNLNVLQSRARASCNPSTQQAEAGERSFRASVGYRVSLKPRLSKNLCSKKENSD